MQRTYPNDNDYSAVKYKKSAAEFVISKCTVNHVTVIAML